MDNFIVFLRFIPGVPKIQELLKINTYKPKPTKFFKKVVSKTLQVRRKDMVDLMLDCIKEGEQPVATRNNHY